MALPLYPQRKRPEHSLKRTLGGPQSHSGHVFAEVNKLSPPPGIEPQIIQPIA